MRCRQKQAAAGEMRAHEIGQRALRRGIEGGRGFIEQPDRPWDGDEARERKAATLPGREVERRQAGEFRKADGRERGIDFDLWACVAEEFRPEGEVLANRE